MIRGIDKRVVIVGAGPVGLYFAYLFKKNNPDIYVSVFEKNSDSGNNVSCGGLISLSGFNKTYLSKILDPKDFVLNKLGAVKVFSPYKFELDINAKKNMAYVIDRDKFDKLIKNLALSVGVEINYNCSVEKIKNNFLYYNNLKKNETNELYFDYLVGADGPNSVVRKHIPFNYNKSENMHAYQIVAEGSFNPKYVSVYLGGFSKSFFSWVIPIDKHTSKIGIGTLLGKNPKDALDLFIKKKNITVNKIISESSGIIPISKPLKNYVYQNIILLGDAAFFVKPTTGGGINFGLLSCECAEKALTNKIKSFKSLNNYNKLISRYVKELNMHYKIRSFLFSKTDAELEDFIIKIKQAGITDFLEKYGDMDYPSLFVTRMFLKPKILKLFPEVIKFFKS